MVKEALVIVDMSNDFIADEGSLTVGKEGQAIVAYIKQLADKFIQADKPVVVSMDAHQPQDSHFDLWPAHNVVGTEGQALYGELQDWFEDHQDHPQVIYSPKTNYNAFFQTGLGQDLRSRGVEKVHIVGVTTDICVFQSIGGADAEGFKTATHRQGVATFTDLGDLMLEHMTRCFHTEII